MPFGNSRIDIARQVNSIFRYGEKIQVYKSNKCSCSLGDIAISTDRSNPNCPQCFGAGYIYENPVWVIGILSGYDVGKQMDEYGIVQPGDVALAMEPRSRVILSTYDKVTMPYWEDGEAYEGELVTRGSVGDPDTLHYRIVYIDAISAVDPLGNITTYTRSQYTFSPRTRLLIWNTGQGPVPGTIYAVRYRAQYDWWVWHPPTPRYSRGTQIGQRVLLRKMLFGQPLSVM